MENIKLIKKATLSWAHETNVKDDKELIDLDQWIQSKTNGKGGGFNNLEEMDKLIKKEKRRRNLLEEKEVSWNLKSRAIWLNYGDEKTKFFRPMPKVRN